MTVALPNEELMARARRIKLVLTDCDGVLTDTGVYYSERGEELKRFSIRDGMGFERLRNVGVAAAIITGELSGSVKQRADKLTSRAHLGVKDKVSALPQILAEAGITLGEVGYIGDDVNDLGAIARVAELGLTAAPRDAMPEVKRVVHYVCEVDGGRGAFRDFAEWILRLRSAGTG